MRSPKTDWCPAYISFFPLFLQPGHEDFWGGSSRESLLFLGERLLLLWAARDVINSRGVFGGFSAQQVLGTDSGSPGEGDAAPVL